ncbi:TPA: hypothetical protein BOS_22682 [Bos taurus]|nr:TPA: hypothetical protein BOS_22682 [Bos taurus]
MSPQSTKQSSLSYTRCNFCPVEFCYSLFCKHYIQSLGQGVRLMPGTQPKHRCQTQTQILQKHSPGLGSRLGFSALLFRTDSNTAWRNSLGGKVPAILEAVC